MSYSPGEVEQFLHLYSANLIPLRVVLAALTWVIYDYFDTLEDEVRHIWSQKFGIGKCAYLFIRYYTILLLAFDAVQIHTFAAPGITSLPLCVAMDPIIRVVGAVSLWAIEIVMQLRVYALFDCSRKVAIFNAIIFIMSVLSFVGLLVKTSIGRSGVIVGAMRFPLRGCPVINNGPVKWAQWIPATAFEVILFGFVLYKAISTLSAGSRMQERVSIHDILINDNMLYFFGITILLVLNNLMTTGCIPWFGFGPFHAAMGIMTTRMLMHLKKAMAR